MKKSLAVGLIAMIGLTVVMPSAAQQTTGDHVIWVAGALTRMQTIKPGMTRKTLLIVFTTEGGISTRLRRTFVSRDCPYFKVDVEFQAAGRSARDENDRALFAEDNNDVILKLSKPYLQFSVVD